MLEKIEQYLADNEKLVASWMQEKLGELPPPIFTSVDIRNAGFKIAHVDTNLYPAGFNNLSDTGLNGLTTQLAKHLSTYYPNARKVLLYPENITRNMKYIESLSFIESSLKSAGYETEIASPIVTDVYELDGKTLDIKLLIRKEDFVCLENGWTPEVIILNNDLTTGVPAILENISQHITPSLNLGWHVRRKYHHFVAFQKLINEFAEKASFDPWFLSTLFENCGNVDFRDKIGLECLAEKVERIKDGIAIKYKEYGIAQEPYVFIKANQGTYGMGVMAVQSGDAVLQISKKSRHSMQSIKSGVKNSSIMVQEGIPTVEKFTNYSSEALAYMCNGEVIEIFSRWHDTKDHLSSLNSRGAQFSSTDQSFSSLKIFLAKLAAIATNFEETTAQ